MKDLLVNLLALVPEPHVQAAAATLRAVLAEVRRSKARAAAQEAADDEALLAEAVAEALEPWRRIKARADAELAR